MRTLLVLVILLTFINGYSQNKGFPFGETLLTEVTMKSYEKDTTANAVVLNEFGDVHFNTENFNLVFSYHVKIKILKTDGLSKANIVIPLYRSESGKTENLLDISASTFNFENNRIEETKLDIKNIFTENVNNYWNQKKFALPNVRVGSVIEIMYTIESPFFYKLRKWEFQSDIPKLRSEYLTTIPGNYTYNTTLRGYLRLSKNESKILPKCITFGSSYQQVSADCSQNRYVMVNIPAFIEEDYMTSASNYLAALNFELSEIRYFDGRVDKVTKEWKDAEQELKKDSRFGVQLKRGKDIGQKIKEITEGINEPKEKALKIYNYIKNSFTWNGTYDYFSDLGIKKAFDSKTGNIGDINLTLIAALKFGGISADPMLLSTRENGLPIELYPVLSDFNYVVAYVTINDQVYLLDASDPFMMFGMLPERCINGKGRVFSDKGSFWVEIKSSEKSKKVTTLNLLLEENGLFKGTIEHVYTGYKSFDQRKLIASYSSMDEYVSALKKKTPSMNIVHYEIKGFEDFESSITEKFDVIIEGYDDLSQNTLLLNPFFTDKIESNPFKSKERLYPVDFGVPMERNMTLILNMPKQFELVGKPESTLVTLPNSGGKFLFDVVSRENQIIVNYGLSINKTIFQSQEYQYLKELFSRIIQTQQTDLVFNKK